MQSRNACIFLSVFAVCILKLVSVCDQEKYILHGVEKRNPTPTSMHLRLSALSTGPPIENAF